MFELYSSDPTDVPPLRMSSTVFAQIVNTIGSRQPECGGILGSDPANGIVSTFHLDDAAATSRATYSPDVTTINRVINEDWRPRGILLAGFIHSHPRGGCRPSQPDIDYAIRIAAQLPEPRQPFLLLIAQSQADSNSVGVAPWVVETGVGSKPVLRRPLLELVDEVALPVASTSAKIFTRVHRAYDLPRMAGSRIVGVGAGGSAAFYEDMVRSGVGQIVLIDTDVVSATNIATQDYDCRDVGRTKVDVLAERLHQINPAVTVHKLPCRVEDLSDNDLVRLLHEPLPECSAPAPRFTLLCGMTDNFHSQALVNLIALKHQVASLCAQVYYEGRGAEITFTLPGMTRACHRCILKSRYDHYARGLPNSVTSSGTPIVSTSRLNATKGQIAIALLHHRTAHPRWEPLLSRIAKRNLVLIRLDPDIHQTVGLGVFQRAFHRAMKRWVLSDETLWLPQERDPKCPDCAGIRTPRRSCKPEAPAS